MSSASITTSPLWQRSVDYVPLFARPLKNAMIDTVDAIMITLDVASEQALFILVAADGTVNRLGTGSVGNNERDLFIGITEEPLFEQVRAEMHPAWFDRLGAYDVPDKQGLLCELTILMKHSDGMESGLQFRYGSESQGPPEDVCHFITRAISLTEPWYRQQQKMTAGSTQKHKPWWKFW